MGKATKITYEFREGRSYPVPAQRIGEELVRIRSAYGSIDPEVIVEEAKNESSPLHRCFRTWDVTAAAHEYWKDEARVLASSVVQVVITKEGRQERSFNVSIVKDDGHRGYEQSVRVTSDHQVRQQLLGESAAVIRGWFDRFELLGMLGPFIATVEVLLETYRQRHKEKTTCQRRRRPKSPPATDRPAAPTG
jgi:hypothetical protein